LRFTPEAWKSPEEDLGSDPGNEHLPAKGQRHCAQAAQSIIHPRRERANVQGECADQVQKHTQGDQYQCGHKGLP